MDYSPVNYQVTLHPDLISFTFTGSASIEFEIINEIEFIDLNALDLEINSVTLVNGEVKTEISTEYNLDTQILRCNFGKKVDTTIILHLEFSGTINDKLVGFYQSRYSIGDQQRTQAVTQFQESDARRAFPCIDEPGIKSTFDITLVVASERVAVSNTSVKEKIELDNGKVKYVFDTTPIMSTYLLFFGVGDFEGIESMQGNTMVRVLASPGEAEKYGEFALDFSKKSLQYCEEYYGIPFPLPKLDNIATADFAHGAMENWGAILYRENLLLVYPGVTSKRKETIIQMVIAHEIAHQWFGNLVSPATWKYIWLNESFATFFGYGTIDVFYKEKNIWELFLQMETNGALTADAYIETTPIEVEGDGAMGLTIKSAPIIYNKGGSILRMLEAYVGYNNFREGLRVYLNKYKYSTATSSDLWNAIGETSGMNIGSLMETWVLQTGHPLVTVSREGSKLKLTQQRYTYLPFESDTLWDIPVSITEFKGTEKLGTKFILLKDREQTYNLKDTCTSFKINENLTGFFRVNYPQDNFDELKHLIEAKTLSPIDRYNLVNEYFSMLRAGKIKLEQYLDIIPSYLDEDNYLSIAAISSELIALYNLFEGEKQAMISRVGKQFTEAMLEKHGYEQQNGEAIDITSTRGSLLVNAVKFGSMKAKDYALGLYQSLKDGSELSADLLPSILNIAAFTLNDREFLLNGYEKAENEQECVLYLGVLGEFTDPDFLMEMQSYAFDKVPGRNRTSLIDTIINNPVAKKTIWQFYLANLDNFEALHGYMYQMSLVNLIRNCVDEREEVEKFFLNYIKKRANLADAIDVGLEQVRINEQLLRLNN